MNEASAGQIRQLAESWLGKPRLSGDHLFELNPVRADRHIGSLAINIGLCLDLLKAMTQHDMPLYMHGLTPEIEGMAFAADAEPRSLPRGPATISFR